MEEKLKADYKKSKEEAVKLLKSNYIKEPPVIARELAENSGLTVETVDFNIFGEEFKNVSGFIHAKSRRLFVNSVESPRRRNFTIAHELGHHILGHTNNPGYTMLYRNSSFQNKQPMEQEADCFAANLLVPEDFLKKYIKEYPFAADYDLATIFGVSEIVIRYRKSNLRIV